MKGERRSESAVRPAGPTRAPVQTLNDILTAHCRRYPLLQAQDLYKLLHQAAMGGEHAVVDVSAARRWLDRELADLPCGPAEPLVDPISPDGQVVRVHLRPFLAAGGSPAALLEAFVRSANEHRGSLANLKAWWAEAEAMAAAGLLPVAAGALALFWASRQAQGFPACHHSPACQAVYRPAYRVVVAAHLPAIRRTLRP